MSTSKRPPDSYDGRDAVVAAPTARGIASAGRPSIVQIEAAKLRLVTDRRLGKQTPEWVERVAQGMPSQPAKAAG